MSRRPMTRPASVCSAPVACGSSVLRLGPGGSDLLPVGKAVRSAHDRASLERSGAAGLVVLVVVVEGSPTASVSVG